MATQASLSLVPQNQVAVVADAAQTIRHVRERRPLARTAAAYHLYTAGK